MSSALAGEEAYRDFSEGGVRFLGPGRDVESPDTLSAVRLGLSGPARGAQGQHLRLGVQLALDAANTANGYGGLPYESIFKPDDESWSVVAGQIVSLVYKHEVWGIISSLDGERAHAAEMVVAKLWTPVITPGAADLTIDFANVPWVFRLMPHDRLQAELLVRAAHERGFTRLALATEGVREGQVGHDRVTAAAHALQRPLHAHVEFHSYDAPAAAPRLASSGADALILWGRPEAARELIRELRRQDVSAPVFVPASLVGPELAQAHASLGAVLGAAPFDLHADDPDLLEFRRRFEEAAGVAPTHLAAYAYDAAQLYLAAINAVGLNRVRIADWLLKSRWRGVTGDIAFNSLGGNMQEPVLVELRDGDWRRP